MKDVLDQTLAGDEADKSSNKEETKTAPGSE